MMMHCLKISLVLAALLLFGREAYAQDVSVQQEKKAKLEREIAIIDRQLAENASQSNTMLSDLTLIRKKIANRKALVAEADRQVKRYNDSIYLTNREINRMRVRIDTLTSHYSRLVKSAYKNRDARVWYMYMFASENLGQAFRRFGYFRNLSTHMKTEAQQIRDMQAEKEKKKERLSQKLQAVTGKTIDLCNRVDPSCLGGVRLDYDGKRVDDTVSHRLGSISALLKNTVL